MLSPSLDAACRLDALLEAWAKVKGNKGAAGGDGVTWQIFSDDTLPRLNRLRSDVLAGTYRPGPLRRTSIPKKTGGRRPLTIPCLVDRVLQTAIANALSPLFEAEFEPGSYGYRPGRSVAMAVGRVDYLRRQGYRWTVDADIRKYFERVPHDKLMTKVRKLVPDDGICNLIELWLTHAESDGDGLAQGSPLSPLLANLYLDELDETLDGKSVRIIRFADDFVLLCKSEESAHKALADAQNVLTRLGLEYNLEKTSIRAYDEGLPFLGRLFVRSLVLDPEYAAEDTAPSRVERAGQHSEPREPEEDYLPPLQEAPRTHSSRIKTLYVYDKGARLTAESPHFVVYRDGIERLRLPRRQLQHIDIGPHAMADTDAMRLAAAAGIDVTLSDGWGHVASRLESGPDGSAARHLMQAKSILDDDQRMVFARAFVDARLRGQRALLRKLNKARKDEDVAASAETIGRIIRGIGRANDSSQLMGHEGRAAALYWPALGQCLLHDWTFTKRTRRPPRDPFNLTVSFLSQRLTNDIRVLITRHGLHPGFGYLHAIEDRERETLALDVVEIFRAPLAEGLAIYLFNNRYIKPEHFVKQKGKYPIRAMPVAVNAMIRGYENRLGKTHVSQFSGSRVSWRGLMEEQVMAIRETIDHGEPLQIYKRSS